MTRPQVILVGGLAFNVPKELAESVEIVKHIEQTSSYRVGTLPAADYIFVISDFASHNLVDIVKNQVKAPIVYLQKGWASMKTELQKRSILPPDSSPQTREPEAAATEVPTTTGLSEDELWKTYKVKLIEAAKGSLIPRELVSENDLVETLGDLVGIPPEDCRRLLPKLHMGGTVVEVQDHVWSLLIGGDSYEFDTSPPTEKKKTRRTPAPAGESMRGHHLKAINAARTEKVTDRASKIAGLLMGPYPTIIAIIREMQKYKEFLQEDGTPYSTEIYRRMVKKAIELKLVDDTHEKIFVDHKPEVALTPVIPPEPPLPTPQPLTPEGETEQYWETIQKEQLGKMAKEEAERHWAYVVNEVKKQKRHLGTILENGRIEWLPESAILIFLVPTEFSVYLSQLESTENWGLISTQARMKFGPALVIRFVLDNGVRKVRA